MNVKGLDPIDVSEFEALSCSYSNLDFQNNRSFRRYLEFAKLDLSKGETDRHCINAVSNAKRALHLRVENLTLVMSAQGCFHKSRFPEKLKFCEECGISTPGIIRRLNRFRNSVEHDYIDVDIVNAHDFVDIVSLFLDATSKFEDKFPDSIDLSPIEMPSVAQAIRSVTMSYLLSSGEISVRVCYTDQNKAQVFTICSSNRTLYCSWMRTFIQMSF